MVIDARETLVQGMSQLPANQRYQVGGTASNVGAVALNLVIFHIQVRI